MQPAQERSAASAANVIITRRGKGGSPWKMISATGNNDFTFRHLFNKVENKHGRATPRAIRARRSLREVPRARLRRSRRPEGDEGAFLGPRDPAGRGRPPCGPAAPRRARMDSLGVARDPVSRGRARLHFPRSRPPVSRSAGPREPDRSDRPGRGPGDGGRDRPVSPRGVRGPRGDDRALPAHGGVPRADDRGDPRPLLPRPVRPRAVRPRGGHRFPGRRPRSGSRRGGRSGFAGRSCSTRRPAGCRASGCPPSAGTW